MDYFEISSNCSGDSRHSECISSNISSLSSLSEYQDEFIELKQLVNQEDVLNNTTKSGPVASSIIRCYEKQIVNINTQLQIALKQNERYKNDIYSLEKKNDHLHAERIEKLLKQNKQLEDNLLAANNQIKRLIDICHKKDDLDANIVLLEENNLHLEKVNHDLTNQIHLLSNKINHTSFQKSEVEHENKNLKSEVNGLKLELVAKTECVNELKKKISEQHVQLQEILHNNVKLSHSVELVSNELQHAKKSESWYKVEVQRIQQEKNIFSDKILKNEKIIALQDENIEQLNLELNSLKCACDGIRLAALREKEEMCKQIQSVNYDEYLAKQNKENLSNCDNIASSIGSISSHYETIINDLTSDVKKIKSNFEQQQEYIEHVSREKNEILNKHQNLQSSLSEKVNTVEILEHNINDLKNKLVLASTREEKQNLKLLDLKNACTKLEVELNLKNKDKEMFEGTVTTIREQFKLLSGKYVQLKNLLHHKDKELLQLHYEKQELCVDDNRKTAEFRRIMEKDALEIKKLNQRIIFLEEVERDVKFENKKQCETIRNLNVVLIKLQTHLDNCHTKNMDVIPNYINVLESNNDNNGNVDAHSQEVEVPNASQYYPPMNNHEGSRSFKIIDTLKYICKLCKISEDHYIKNSNMDSDEEYIKMLLNKIESYHQSIDSQRAANYRKKLDETNRNILSKILHLVERCKLLEKQTEENGQMLKLKLICCKHDQCTTVKEEIRNLEVQLEVKSQEEKVKQKRYERNYRTLLRKVKEHMKGRKVAEKRNDFLQELHNTLSNERNTVRLQLDLKQSELNEVQNRLESYSIANQKLKFTVVKLEKEIVNFSSRCKCGDFEVLKSKYVELETSVKKCEDSKNASLAELKLREEQLDMLQKDNKLLLVENSSKCARIIDLESQLTEIQSCEDRLRKEFVVMENNISKTHNDISEMKIQLDHITNKNIRLNQEAEQLNSCLQRKSEEINEFKLRKEQAVRRWSESETNMQKLITILKNQVYTSRGETELLKNEKFFLQRLCNDLNVALKTHINQNKTLKEYVERICKERERIGNDTNILASFPSPIKCDDTYIQTLLQDSMMPLQDKPYCDIQKCLNTLKKEIFCLQKQIAEKSVN